MRFTLLYVLLAIFAIAVTESGFGRGKKNKGGFRSFNRGGYREVGAPFFLPQIGLGYASRFRPINRSYHPTRRSFYG